MQLYCKKTVVIYKGKREREVGERELKRVSVLMSCVDMV